MKSQLKVGDLIRRMLTSGTPVGGYLEVDEVTENGVYAHHISPYDTLGSFYVCSKEVFVPKSIRLRIPKEDLLFLIENKPLVYRHRLTKTWEDAANKRDSTIATLWATGTKSTYTVEGPEFVRSLVHIKHGTPKYYEKQISTIMPHIKMCYLRVIKIKKDEED